MNFYKTPTNDLPVSKSLADAELNFNRLSIDSIDSWYFKEAFENPGVTQVNYHSENGYQYEYRANWNPNLKIMTTNWQCPVRAHHHYGTRCQVCGLKD